MTNSNSKTFLTRFQMIAVCLTILFNLSLDALMACEPNDPSCQDNLGCNDEVNVTLQGDCSVLLTPDMFLEGGLGCLTNYQQYFKIRIVGDDPDETNETFGETTVDGCGRFIYEIIFDRDAFCNDGHRFNVNFPLEGCWGYINAEDKTRPAFICDSEVIEEVEMEVEAQQYSGNTGAPALYFDDQSCYREVGAGVDACKRGYDLISDISSNIDATYTFYLNMPGASGTLAIYQGRFDPDAPCANIIAQSSVTYTGTSTSTDGFVRISLPMESLNSYAIVVTTDDDACSSNQAFDLFAVSDLPDAELTNFGETIDKEIIFPLFCVDVDRILNSDDLIDGPEIQDNCASCDAPEIWFEDVLTENGDCGGSVITRTWYARDSGGNESLGCTQTIRFRNVRLTDVVRPPKTVPIECDEDFPLDAEGNPHPDFTGYPFVLTASGIFDLNDSYCNVGATYRDISRIDVCDGSYKIVREWTIIDWCYIPGQYDLNNSPLINYRQVVKLGDFSGPDIGGLPEEALVFPTGPFSCESSFAVPPVSIDDNCSNYTVRTEVFLSVKQPIYDRYGRLIGEEYEYVFFREADANGYVSGIPINDPDHPHKLIYYAEDGCDNLSETEIYFEVKDDIEPVVVCDDDLRISVGGDGIGRIAASDLDEGSWDNCSLDTVLISRKLIDDDRRNAYLNQIYGLSFSDLEKSPLSDLSNQDTEIWVLKSEEEEKTPVLRFRDDTWYTWWKNEVWFICEDMTEEVAIELLAVDISNNSGLCWLDVLIEDKILPFCIPPDDVRLACTELPYGFDPEDDAQLEALFGAPKAEDNCPGSSVEQLRKIIEDWDCNSGLITRYFGAEDAKGQISTNSCKQQIEIYRVHDYEIKFPKDAEADCRIPSPDTIAVAEIACDLLSINVMDERFTASGEACYKIRRTYKVINWCEFNGEDEPVVVGRNTDCDSEVGEEDVYVLVRPDLVTYVDRDNDESANPLNSPCSNGAEGHLDNSLLNEDLISVGYWEYAQFIKVYDRDRPEVTSEGDNLFCSFNNECNAQAAIPLSVVDFCAGEDVEIKIFLLPDPATGLSSVIDLQIEANAASVDFVFTGVYPDYTLNGRFPLGDHTFEVHVIDGCQNSSLLKIPFSVEDCKAPTPICINGLAIELMPTEAGTDADGDGDEDAGAMSVWASDFSVSNLGDCSPEVTLSINRQGETPNREQKNIVFTCDDRDTVAVEIYAWDGADNPTAVQPDGSSGGANYDYCLTYVVVQDNMFDLCAPGPGLAAVGGLILTDEQEMVEKVEVLLSGDLEREMTTTNDGFYMFNGLQAASDYTVTPIRDNDYLNGVSTFDLVLITKHILNTQPFDSPYKIIASDINRSNTITVFDLVHLRKMILSVSTRFPNNTSWRFVPASYRFPDATNPWKEAFPEVLNYNDLQEVVTNGDFVAIKIGDVNGNAKPNSLVTEERSLAGVFKLRLEDRALQAGKKYRLTFTTDDLKSIPGFQFTLNLAGLELADMEYGLLRPEHFGFPEEGTLTVSWNQALDGRNLEDSFHPAFHLIVVAKQNALLSDLLQLNSRFTRSEAYTETGALLDVALQFSDERNLGDSFHLHQNVPNPFREQTSIRFELPEARQATIRIHDLNGKTLKVIRAEYTRGVHQININREDLPPVVGAMLYYTLETDDFSATRKMVLDAGY